jgi:hypothetical protein
MLITEYMSNSTYHRTNRDIQAVVSRLYITDHQRYYAVIYRLYIAGATDALDGVMYII